MKDKPQILIVNYGDASSKKIAERVSDFGIPHEIIPIKTSIGKIYEMAPKGIILSGSSPRKLVDNEILKLDIPVLGICYGHQLLAKQFGGKVKKCKEGKVGEGICRIDRKSPLFKGINRSEIKVKWDHQACVTKLPFDFKTIAKSDHSEIAGMQDVARNIYSVQFHPESLDTIEMERIFHNFLFPICGCIKPEDL